MRLLYSGKNTAVPFSPIQVGAFQRGVGHFKRTFQVEGNITHQLRWYQKTRMITLSWGIKISAVYSFVTKHAVQGHSAATITATCSKKCSITANSKLTGLCNEPKMKDMHCP